MKSSLIIATVAVFSIAAANAEADAFTALDVDQSGGVSIDEARVAVPDLSAEEFAAYDADTSGELSADEFKAWAAAKSGETDNNDQ